MTVASVPIRTCVGCRSRREQSALRRFVRAVNGEVCESRTAAGRGAWVCAESQNCLERAFATRGFDRSFGVRSHTKNTNLRNRLTMAK